MKEKDLPIDRSRHMVYSNNAKKCVKKLLHRYYNSKTAEELWERIQMQYVEYLKEEPALKDLKITASIYDPILIFAWYVTIPDKPPIEEVQQDVFECFMGGFDLLGKIFNLNRSFDNRLAHFLFKQANDVREEEIKDHPESFRVGYQEYDRQNGIIRYNFTQCPNAEFARRHHLEHVLPVMCNCDHLAMQKIHASLIRCHTCGISDNCDYCIVGDQNPLAEQYAVIKDANGLMISVKKDGLL